MGRGTPGSLKTRFRYRLEGYDASYLNQPIEVPELREHLRETLQTDPYPQLLIRVGRGEFAAHTPRRPFDQVAS